MIFSLIVILAVLAVAFFHYTQGFFSATLSAIIAVIAAMMAISYHEPFVATLLQGRVADQANAIALVCIFVPVYLVLRMISDRLVPGNLRFPAMVDKIGAGVMGIVAAVFSVGIVAIAAQTLPFGPSIAGYSRYELKDDRSDAVVKRDGSQDMNATINAELAADTLDPNNQQGLLLPVDGMVLALASRLSDGGSLAGERPLGSVHPDYLQELFGNRLGIQVGADRTALNLPGKPQEVEVSGVYRIESPTRKDAEPILIRGSEITAPEPNGNQIMIVVRAMFRGKAADKDGHVRFSPGSVRLVANQKNYFPIGTLEAANVLFVNKPDDFLILEKADRGADLVFIIDEKTAPVPSEGDAAGSKMVDGSFIEVKRWGRVDLSGKPIQPPSALTASPDIAVMRKPAVVAPKPQDK